MKATTTLERLRDVVARAEKVTGKNLSLPVLRCVLFVVGDKEIRIRATNLDIGVEFRVDDAALSRVANHLGESWVEHRLATARQNQATRPVLGHLVDDFPVEPEVHLPHQGVVSGKVRRVGLEAHSATKITQACRLDGHDDREAPGNLVPRVNCEFEPVHQVLDSPRFRERERGRNLTLRKGSLGPTLGRPAFEVVAAVVSKEAHDFFENLQFIPG